MAKYLRYAGEFLSRAGVAWRVELLQESSSAYSVGELEFPAASPLVIEWQRHDKEEVLMGSSATLKVISPGDRTYEDLYTIAVGGIRMDVYRNGALYWSGTLDPEFYSEPYESAYGYEVELTFSDFGIFERLKYNLDGIRTVGSILTYALQRSGINYGSLNTSLVSTSFPDTTSTPLLGASGLAIRSDNFTDEEGEVSTLKDVLEGLLQPLALKMVQRNGVVYLYDLNGLYSASAPKVITWDGNRQTMDTDKVANNVVVSFSPYSGSSVMSDGDIDYKGPYSASQYNLTNSDLGGYYSYLPDYGDGHKVNGHWDYKLIDFTIFLSDSATGLASIGSGCKYFHILPQTGSATECSGVAYAFRTGGQGAIVDGTPVWKCHTSIPHCTQTTEVLTTKRIFLPKLSGADAAKYLIRVSQSVCIDARYNPFSGSEDGNEEGNDKLLKKNSAFVFIPAKITLYNAAGTVLYHYSNQEAATGAEVGSIGYLGSGREWVAGAGSGDCYLEYYNPDDLIDDCGIRGWQTNRHCIGRPDGLGGRRGPLIYDSFANMEPGEYLPYPPAGGYLEVQILAGVNGYDYRQTSQGDFGSSTSYWDTLDIYGKLRWCLYKAPKVEVVGNNLVFGAAEMDDVDYSGYINRDAKEEISIETICGTADDTCPTARGIYHRQSDGLQVQQLTRAGRTDHPEKLLIGTIYSQYGSRKTTLSGEALIDGGLRYYTEANQGSKRFCLMSDVQDVITDCTDAEYCEFRPDEYDSIDEVE